jgi:hypothetical protein
VCSVGRGPHPHAVLIEADLARVEDTDILVPGMQLVGKRPANYMGRFRAPRPGGGRLTARQPGGTRVFDQALARQAGG